MSNSIRVRFAPSPTGFMHLGNVRTALINYLFARHHQGTFIVRIEDTDQQRLFDAKAEGILRDLAWLGLAFQEGPGVGGPYAPYYQSERHDLYQKHLNACIAQHKAYRCFCTVEELEKKRERQIAQKLPPRYDRACLKLAPEQIAQRLTQNLPFIWRFKLNDDLLTITDLARGKITYDMKHFSDFALTRQDGTCTFIFANYVDDVEMHISHVIRGEDHLSNTASQAALYYGLNKPLPLFWHLPIMANTDGKKLSKRDFGFSLNDLRTAGYLPEAITNYLAILGGSFETEIMSIDEISKAFNFEHISSSGQIKYDIEKLRWFNQKWIQKISFDEFKQRTMPLLETRTTPDNLLKAVQPELVTLNDVIEKTRFYFHAPQMVLEQLTQEEQAALAPFKQVLTTQRNLIEQPELFVKAVIEQAKTVNVSAKVMYALMRLALTGHAQGLGIKELIHLLGTDESYKRFSSLVGA